MYINAHVNNASYFDDIYIDKITIMTEDKVSEMAPEMFTDDYIYQQTIEGNQKELALVLTSSDFNEKFAKSALTDNLFFVYITCKGTPDPSTPCRLDELTTLGVTFDDTLLYQKIMNQTRGLANECEIPQELLDMILLWNGFKAAIETEHYIQAIDFWKKLFKSSNSIGTYNRCGCHG
jgi:hypothetical protein